MSIITAVNKDFDFKQAIIAHLVAIGKSISDIDDMFVEGYDQGLLTRLSILDLMAWAAGVKVSNKYCPYIMYRDDTYSAWRGRELAFFYSGNTIKGA